MKRIILISLLVSVSLTSVGCFRIVKWEPPAIKYPTIPMEDYPEYVIPEDIKTEEDKAQIVGALFKAEKHAMMLRSKIEEYNKFARGKNKQAEELFQ